MLIRTDTPAPSELDSLLTHEQRIAHVTNGLIQVWRDVHSGMLLWEMALLKEAEFVDLMIRTTPKTLTLAQHFTRAHWGQVHEGVIAYTRMAEAAGAAWRKRKGEKMSLKDFREIIRQQAVRAKRTFWRS